MVIGQRDADLRKKPSRHSIHARTWPRQSVSALTCPHSHFTDYWFGANAAYGIEVDNGTGTGDGVRGYSGSTAYMTTPQCNGVNTATTGYGTGVFGSSNNGVGVYAISTLGDGLEATTVSTTMTAIYAHTANSVGLTSRSNNKFGIHTGGGGDASWSDLVGDLYLEGARGEIFTGGDVLEMYSNGFVVFDLDNNNNGINQLEVWNGAEMLVFTVNENGDTAASGTKSASVNTVDYGQRLLYSMESPEVWFEDFGSATLVNGTATVPINSIFAETVNLKEDYRIFLTPLGDCALYVAEKTPASFSVKAIGGQTCSISFDYRIVAKPRVMRMNALRRSISTTIVDQRKRSHEEENTVVSFLILVALLVTTSGSPHSEANASTVKTSVLSGGGYTLTMDSSAGLQSTGYQFFPTGTAALPPTCACCNSYIPCTRK